MTVSGLLSSTKNGPRRSSENNSVLSLSLSFSFRGNSDAYLFLDLPMVVGQRKVVGLLSTLKTGLTPFL